MIKAPRAVGSKQQQYRITTHHGPAIETSPCLHAASDQLLITCTGTALAAGEKRHSNGDPSGDMLFEKYNSIGGRGMPHLRDM